MRIDAVTSTKFGALKISKSAANALIDRGNLQTLKRLDSIGETLMKTKYYDLVLDDKYLRPIIKATKADPTLRVGKNKKIAQRVIHNADKFKALAVQYDYLTKPIIYVRDNAGNSINSLDNIEFIADVLIKLEEKAAKSESMKKSANIYSNSPFYNELENLYKKYGF